MPLEAVAASSNRVLRALQQQALVARIEKRRSSIRLYR